MRATRQEIGLAIVGCGTIGRIRAELARDYPGVGWLGLCDIKADLGQRLKADTGADFLTESFAELLARPEVTAAIIATDENHHAAPALAAIERGLDLFIEKPLATDARQSQQILDAIEAAGIDAVVGYTQRFRRRFLAVKERLITGQIGEVTAVVTRAFMNRMVPLATLRRTNDRRHLTPMVVSGTHSLDMSLWLMDGKTPVSVYARSCDAVLGQHGTKDATFGIFTMDDGTVRSGPIRKTRCISTGRTLGFARFCVRAFPIRRRPDFSVHKQHRPARMNRPAVNLWSTLAGHHAPHGMVGIRRRAELIIGPQSCSHVKPATGPQDRAHSRAHPDDLRGRLIA